MLCDFRDFNVVYCYFSISETKVSGAEK